MFYASNDCSSNLFPVDARIQLFVHKPTDRDIISPNEIQPMTDLCTGLRVIGGADDTFKGVVEDDIGQLIAGEEGACECSTVGSNDQDPFYN